jgi:uncharacterized protein YeaO (DUF488 family)
VLLLTRPARHDFEDRARKVAQENSGVIVVKRTAPRGVTKIILAHKSWARGVTNFTLAHESWPRASMDIILECHKESVCASNEIRSSDTN